MSIKRGIKNVLKNILGIYDYDRKGEKEILKAISLWHRGGRLNRIRAKRLYNHNIMRYGVSIHPNIDIGKNFHLVHADSIRIGEGVHFGDNCKLYPYVHIMGDLKEENKENGIFKKASFGNDCVIGAGAAIIGPVNIGDDVTIGAHAVVTKNVPAHSVVKNVNDIRLKRENEIPEKYKNDRKT